MEIIRLIMQLEVNFWKFVDMQRIVNETGFFLYNDI